MRGPIHQFPSSERWSSVFASGIRETERERDIWSGVKRLWLWLGLGAKKWISRSLRRKKVERIWTGLMSRIHHKHIARVRLQTSIRYRQRRSRWRWWRRKRQTEASCSECLINKLRREVLSRMKLIWFVTLPTVLSRRWKINKRWFITVKWASLIKRGNRTVALMVQLFFFFFSGCFVQVAFSTVSSPHP